MRAVAIAVPCALGMHYVECYFFLLFFRYVVSWYDYSLSYLSINGIFLR